MMSKRNPSRLSRLDARGLTQRNEFCRAYLDGEKTGHLHPAGVASDRRRLKGRKMTDKYLPRRATIAESCEWLNERTGEQWTIARLLEYGLLPWFWLDFAPGWPAIFGDRKEGYLAPMCFAGDTNRLAAGCRDVIVTMTRTHDGKVFRIDEPTWRFDIDQLRFLRDDIKQLSDRWATPSEPAAETPQKRKIRIKDYVDVK